MIVNGCPVVFSPLAMERVGPMRSHKRGRKASYHRRVQKKWLKRWGWKYKPCIFRIPSPLGVDQFVCHPSFKQALQDFQAEKASFSRTTVPPSRAMTDFFRSPLPAVGIVRTDGSIA